MKHFPEKQQLHYKTNVQYYSETGDAKSFLCKTYVSKIAKTMPQSCMEPRVNRFLKYLRGNTMVKCSRQQKMV